MLITNFTWNSSKADLYLIQFKIRSFLDLLCTILSEGVRWLFIHSTVLLRDSFDNYWRNLGNIQLFFSHTKKLSVHLIYKFIWKHVTKTTTTLTNRKTEIIADQSEIKPVDVRRTQAFLYLAQRMKLILLYFIIRGSTKVLLTIKFCR